ncbi:MAG: RNA polymerase sigma factor [Acidobacteria bacterium]|nr:RNA polymerase sigma factor [Acidobacteriota bacterium]
MTTSLPMVSRNLDADAAIVDSYLAGDMTAFDELMIRYERQIYRVCYRFVENREDAMDLAQEVFIKAFEHLPSFRRESSLKTWLYRIAINHCINHVKKHSQEFVEVTDQTGSVHASVHSEMEQREQREHLRRMVKHLPPKQKAILELRINEQLSYEEIARRSGRSVSTIKASVFFALEKLRKLIKDPKLCSATSKPKSL